MQAQGIVGEKAAVLPSVGGAGGDADWGMSWTGMAGMNAKIRDFIGDFWKFHRNRAVALLDISGSLMECCG